MGESDIKDKAGAMLHTTHQYKLQVEQVFKCENFVIQILEYVGRFSYNFRVRMPFLTQKENFGKFNYLKSKNFSKLYK